MVCFKFLMGLDRLKVLVAPLPTALMMSPPPLIYPAVCRFESETAVSFVVGLFGLFQGMIKPRNFLLLS